jgi:hypothetical protein
MHFAFGVFRADRLAKAFASWDIPNFFDPNKPETLPPIFGLITRRKNNELEKTSLNWIGGRGTGFCSRAAF